jgi:hypothetical protein
VDSVYSWQAAYLAAVCETDDDQMAGRILAALAAIEERLLTPNEIEDEELKAIEAAQDGLDGLKTERVIQARRFEPAFASGRPSA